MKTVLILGVVVFSFTLKSIADPLIFTNDRLPNIDMDRFQSLSCVSTAPALDAAHIIFVSIKVDGLPPETDRAESFIRNKLGRRSDDGQTVMFQDQLASLVLRVSLSSVSNADGAIPKVTLSVSATNRTQRLEKVGNSTKLAAATELHWTVTGGAQELKALCEKVATEFDTRMVGPESLQRTRLLAEKKLRPDPRFGPIPWPGTNSAPSLISLPPGR